MSKKSLLIVAAIAAGLIYAANNVDFVRKILGPKVG